MLNRISTAKRVARDFNQNGVLLFFIKCELNLFLLVFYYLIRLQSVVELT